MELKTNNFKRQMQTTDFQQAQNKELIFSVADEMPYLRHDETFGDYYEVLEISEQAIDTTRLVKNMPFLKDHDHSAQLGAVKKFWLQNGKLYVSVKFSRSKFAQSIKEDIIDLIRQNTSIGYYVNQFQRTGQLDGIPILRAVSWTPYECSSVSVPASVWVGYNRSLEVKQKGTQMNAQTDKTNTSTELAEKAIEGKETDQCREDQATIVEDLETKSKETKEEKEMCPECGKPLEECQCEKKACGDNKEKACGEEKPEEKSLEITKEALADALQKQIEADVTSLEHEIEVKHSAIRSLYMSKVRGGIAEQDYIEQAIKVSEEKNFMENKVAELREQIGQIEHTMAAYQNRKLLYQSIPDHVL